MKIVTVIGARPQFVKAAVVSNKIGREFKEVLVHTGQHYDKNMSEIFFEELNIPKPDYNLGVGSGTHGKQTGEMLIKIEEVLINEKPDAVMVYGDTNSTLAGALASSKLNIPVIHIEAGLRSCNMRMPEEQNRKVTDSVSTILFCPTEAASINLKNEGLVNGVYNVGDVMYDAVLNNIEIAEKKYNQYSLINKLNIEKDNYYLSTIHRAENTESVEKLKIILAALNSLDKPVIFPVHPRIKELIRKVDSHDFNKTNIYFVDPVGYLEMLYLIKNSKKVLTDSGGVQKEAYFLGVPCVTLREETEWVETTKGNWNLLSHIVKEDIISNVYAKNIDIKYRNNDYFGNGDASSKIVNVIKDVFS
jgi:UDP-GlcNAc3NAcA epimerase